MSAQCMTKTQNDLQFSLKCHPLHPVIHKDPSIGAHRATYNTLTAGWVVGGIVS